MIEQSNIKKYVLWGGFIGLLVYVLSTAILYPFGEPAQCGFICFPYWSLPTIFVLGILSIALRNVIPAFDVNTFSALAIASLFYIVIGMIIGFIIGKVKTNK